MTDPMPLIPTTVCGSHGLPSWLHLVREAAAADRLGPVDLQEAYDDAVRLCGHSCPTVAGAWLMTAAALRALYPEVPVRGAIEVTVGGARDDGAQTWSAGIVTSG